MKRRAGNPPPPERQCTARTARSGYKSRCDKWSVAGSNVCATHGAAKGTPARKKAHERLRDLIDPTISLLEKAVEELDRRKLWLHPSTARLATLIFDRAGLPARVELEVESSHEARAWFAHTTLAEKRLLLRIQEAGIARSEGKTTPCVAGSKPKPKPKPAPPVEEPDEVVL